MRGEEPQPPDATPLDPRGALEPTVYDELRRIAGRYLRGERAHHTLQATALVHEAWVRMADQPRERFRSRGHFRAIASTMMRWILVDHARARASLHRGGARSRLAIEPADLADDREVDLLALDDALHGLADLDQRQARIVECRFFGGMTIEEVAEALDVSPRTVDREWACAKAWLFHQLTEDRAGPASDREDR